MFKKEKIESGDERNSAIGSQPPILQTASNEERVIFFSVHEPKKTKLANQNLKKHQKLSNFRTK